MKKGVEPLNFNARDPSPWRAAQLNQVASRLGCAEDEIETIQDQIGSISPSGAPGDPGDLTVYYENGKA